MISAFPCIHSDVQVRSDFEAAASGPDCEIQIAAPKAKSRKPYQKRQTSKKGSVSRTKSSSQGSAVQESSHKENTGSSSSKSSRITLRLSETEMAELERACEGRTISDYVRRTLFPQGKRLRKSRCRVPVKNEEALSQVLGLLGETRIANNLNQLAKKANMDVLVLNDIVEAQIQEAYDHVCFMRQSLVKALGLKV